ncbi:hypothetical protein FA950_29055 [Bacillus thuringiensis]|uniref:hypothetical protein n=1 Tax=Bacillus thuringiensis TaxID=1428 RepID=UPI0010AC91A0|nr:hypothetical protein [Bacillus thuringiensis]TKA00026.1 hypothetical protein FA950_29055 [Bacillus thuringiensis]HDX9530421.1 hypothetical protein [Bacillus thuringiensis]
MIDDFVLMILGGLLLLITPGVIVWFLYKNGVNKQSLWTMIFLAAVLFILGLYILITSAVIGS